MRKMLFLLLLVCLIKVLNAQDFAVYTSIDRMAFNIPDSMTNSTGDIARYVKSHFSGDRTKVRSVYVWVTANIRYDKDSANVINTGINPEAKITYALRRRKGVCENFAAIFNDISIKAGLTSFVVNGYTKQSGTIDKTAHSWCAVFIDTTWYLCDPTWDNGSGMNSKYFLVQPAEFIESHMPFDPLWQLLNYTVSHQQFYSGNIYKNKDAPYFNFSDSVTAYLRMDTLHQLQSTELRIQKQGIYNSRIKDNYNYVKMLIEIINQGKDVGLYNSSVSDVKYAATVLNNFIEYRNKRFTPEKTDAELAALLKGVDDKLNSSLKKLDVVDKSQASFTLGTESLRTQLNILLGKIKEQEDFLNQYLHANKSDRKSLFVK
ncbi:MAG: transglutaminase domain-containing protein [Ginsengibacter sp.]